MYADGVNKFFDINDKRKVVCEYSNEPTKLNGFTKLCISNSTYGINCENLFGKADSDDISIIFLETQPRQLPVMYLDATSLFLKEMAL